MRELEGVSTMTCKNVPALWENINNLKDKGIGGFSTPFRREQYITSLLDAMPYGYQRSNLERSLESKYV